MRVRIIFLLKNKGGFVPFHHQYLLAQAVKGIILQGGDPKYLHYSHYNFSGLKGQTKISRNGLHFFSSKITLVFSCLDVDFVNYFIEHLFKIQQLEVGNLFLIPESVEEEHIPELSEECKFICISPMVLLTPKFNNNDAKRFINPETDEFSDLLYESTLTRMASLGHYSREQLESFNKFQVIPDENYLRKIRESQKKFARIYPVYDQDVRYEVRGYTFPFTLFAEKEVQKFVFTVGIGSYAHKGFGMIDLANTDPTTRTILLKSKEETEKEE